MERIRRYQIRLYTDRNADLIALLDTHLERAKEEGITNNHALAALLGDALSRISSSEVTNWQILDAIEDLKSQLNRGIIVPREEVDITEPQRAARNLDAAIEKFSR